MGLTFPLAAALIAVASPGAVRAAPATFAQAPSPALRFTDGASAIVMVSARIVRASAGVGAQGGPPAPHMKPRHASVTAADGSAVPALIYDFE